MSSSWGERIRVSIFGGSHTRAIGATVEGLPPGETIDWDLVLEQMARRAPGQGPTATPRREADTPQVLCGLLEGVTTGAPLTAVIENTSQRSRDYDQLKVRPRPGHADYAAQVKFGGYQDVRGGGHFSGRLTAPLVFAGAVCRQLLERRGVLVGSHVAQIGAVKEAPFDGVAIDPGELTALSRATFPVRDPAAKAAMEAVIAEAKAAGDSVGGVVECAVLGLPAGLGEPIFDGVENLLSSIVYGIPAVKGVAFGSGFAAAAALGSQNNDPFYYDGEGRVRTRTNHAGGILGGITTGMPVVFRAAFKPTPSIAREQDTVNLVTGENVKLSVGGRHDPCIVPRGAPAVEAAACIACCELLARAGKL